MSHCRDIQPELSAYVDGELSPSQRAEIEVHVASCAQCQQELAGLQTLAAGMTALPKLQPPPQFLAEVRRKIVRGDRPEPVTWHDYLFRPYWLKVPLEAVAVMAVVVLVARFAESPAPNEERVGPYQMANIQNADSERERGIGNGAAIAPEPATKAKPAQAPAGGEEKHMLDSLVKGGSATPAVTGGNVAYETRRRAVISPDLQGASAPPSTPDTAALAQDVGIDPSKLGGVMIVNDKSAGAVRSQAEKLVARCNGTIITAPQSEDFAGQVFFVEIPQEYAATFRLEMSRISHAPSATDAALARNESGATTGAAPASVASTGAISGVLTGSRSTNATASSSRPITIEDIVGPKKPATVVLEIVVMPPKK